jgi:putative membrane protein insertion efficiency factor
MIKRACVRLIHAYQVSREGRPSPCRFYPSCSSYALEALEVHGTGRGLWLTARRLLRCRPFGPSGFDPVPDPHQHHRHDAHGTCVDGHDGAVQAPAAPPLARTPRAAVPTGSDF